ncbi:hypothetical protein YB2330_002644 [Saitoella coloradoensis]
MPRDPLIAFVGKPSAGKSSMLNALTDATAKVGNFPFTTIEPNRAVGYLQIKCACARFGKQEFCKPTYGTCNNGTRHVPIQLLDVAGLVPGAHEGRGLGNKFLDDLRHADCLVHVVDVSGTTDAEGKETRGYDPSVDIEWLRGEIVRWVGGNLREKWGSIVRRHVAIKGNAVDTLQGQFSGYGSTANLVARYLDRLGIKQPLEHWDDSTIERVVEGFVDEKFPTVLALNKVDHGDADMNIAKIAKQQKPGSIVLCSAATENLLKRLKKQGYIQYEEGTEFVDTKVDLVSGVRVPSSFTVLTAFPQPDSDLKPLEEKLQQRIEDLRDLVLYRHGSTGVHQVLQRAADLLGLIPVYTVKNTHTFSSSDSSGKTAVFRDCTLVRRGITVGDVAQRIMGGDCTFIEGVGGVRVSEDDLISEKNNILSFKIGARAA